MTLKIYRKAFAGIALATSLLLTALVGGASAATGTRVNELTGRDLLNGGLSVGPTTDVLNEGLHVARHNVAPAELSHGSSHPVRFSSTGLTTASVSTPLDVENFDVEHFDVEHFDAEHFDVEHFEPNYADAKYSDSKHVEAVAETSMSAYKADDTQLPTVVETVIVQPEMIAQADIEVAQDIGDTFAPLSDDEIRQLLLIDSNAALDRPRATPSSGFLTPSAYGADWGDVFVGLAGASAGNVADIDGSASFGFGLGDAVDNVGVELSVGIISLDGFADDGIAGFKLHKVFPEVNNLAVAVGWSNPVKWGLAEQEEDTFYGVVTQRYDIEPGEPNPLPLTVSLGLGTGSFRSTGAIAAGNNDPNFFGSLGLRVLPELSVVSSWTGSGLGMAVSTAPFDFPLVFTAGFSDVTDNTAEGTRFNGAMGYSFSFR